MANEQLSKAESGRADLEKIAAAQRDAVADRMLKANSENISALSKIAIEVVAAQQSTVDRLAKIAERAGIGTATETYYAQDDVTPVITLTPDANGNGLPVITP